jgi:hypothetical protein
MKNTLEKNILPRVLKLKRTKGKILAVGHVPLAVGSQLHLQVSRDNISFMTVASKFVASPGDEHLLWDSHPSSDVCWYRIIKEDATGARLAGMSMVMDREVDDMGVELDVADSKKFQVRLANAAGDEDLIVTVYDRLGNEIHSFLERVVSTTDALFEFTMPGRLRRGLYEVICSFPTKIFHRVMVIV